MAPSEKSIVGFAEQSAKGTPANAGFTHLLFGEGGMGPQNVTLPLDTEIGGGALLRSVANVGVTANGAFSMIPRPKSLGYMLKALLGGSAVPAVQGGGTAAYLHAFTMGADQFDAPYYTFQVNPGGIASLGEVFPDCRIAALSLSWKAANYLRGQLAVLGSGKPQEPGDPSTWTVAVDNGPQFISTKASIELPTGDALKVLGGSITMAASMPLNDQWICGSETVDDLEITQKAFAISLTVKVGTSGALYKKLLYDKDAGGSGWVANILREGDFLLDFQSDQMADAVNAIPYSLSFAGNGQAGDAGNVVWSATPVAMRAGRPITMQINGTFLADDVNQPITVSLVNTQSTQY